VYSVGKNALSPQDREREKREIKFAILVVHGRAGKRKSSFCVGGRRGTEFVSMCARRSLADQLISGSRTLTDLVKTRRAIFYAPDLI
jgi:hypothetical protein